MTKLQIGIILGTTREGRFVDVPAGWINEHLSKHDDIHTEIIDLRDYPMPFFEETTSPAYARPGNDIARRWAAKIAEMDGFVFVTAEYNRSIPGVLKNALDYAYREFNKKPAAFVGYGGVGAARAIEQLRLICVELQLVPLRNAVHIAMDQYLAIANGEKQVGDFDFLNASAVSMIEDLVWWGQTLAGARNPSRLAADCSGLRALNPITHQPG